MILSSLLFIDKSPITLRNIISTRAVFSTIMEKISTEIVNENVVISEINKIEYTHHIDLIQYAAILICILYIMKSFIMIPKMQKLERIEMFSNIQRRTSTFIFVFMLIFTKNIDSVT